MLNAARFASAKRLLVPPVRAIRRAFVFSRRAALQKEVHSLISTAPDSMTWEQAERLVNTWGMKSGADPDLLMDVAEYSKSATGPVLECGSGLTTFVAGVYASHGVWALEHHRGYWQSMMRLLDASGIKGVQLVLAPLDSYGDFDWYSLPEELPDTFSLVICDGPPSDTRGGRAGMMEVVGSRIAPDSRILLDDYRRDDGQRALEAWAERWRQTTQRGTRHAVLARND